ncbi:MAG TPA: hypothetical protein VF266_18665 [Thermoanaerobaculia bacterium]
MPDGGQVLTVARDKRGFEDVIRIAPGWLPSYHRYAWTAHRKGDHEIARECALMPEGHQRPRYGPPPKEKPPAQRPPPPPPPAEPPPPDFTKWPHLANVLKP